MLAISPLRSEDIPACVQIMLNNPLWQQYWCYGRERLR